MDPGPISSASPSRAARSLHVIHDPPRVLLAEDDAEMRKLVVETLERDGFVVRSVPDGGRLLVEVSQQIAQQLDDVDLIVSDIRMPVASGLQIVEAIRAARCWTPVILMTAFGDESACAQAERLGAWLFDKPFVLDDLRVAARTLLGLGTDQPTCDDASGAGR